MEIFMKILLKLSVILTMLIPTYALGAEFKSTNEVIEETQKSDRSIYFGCPL